jgi:hypothetical protein
METKTLEEIEFNVSKALVIIEKDKDLDAMFRETYATDYKMCHALINSGTGLKKEAEEFIKGIFDGIILEKKVLREAYQSLVEGVSEGVSEGVKKNVKKRWGLQAIASDIVEFFGGKGKQIHSTAKRVQELKKIFVRLEMKMYNERFTKETLTESQLREISGAIDTFNKKVDSVLNPKK